MDRSKRKKSFGKNVYVASDETEFETERECQAYEAKLELGEKVDGFSEVLSAKQEAAVANLIASERWCADFFLVKPRTAEDIRILADWIRHMDPGFDGNDDMSWIGNEDEIRAGETYIVGLFDFGAEAYIYSKERLQRMADNALAVFSHKAE